MSFFRRRATLLAARSNLTTLDISDQTPPSSIEITPTDLAAYRAALSWLLDYAAAGIPAPSSFLEVFWSNQGTLDDDFVRGFQLQNFRSILAFPVWLFNANNYGNTALAGQVLNPDLPKEFYTQAAVVRPMVRLKFDGGLLRAFVVLEGLVLLVLWGALLWLFAPWSIGAGDVLAVSPFPVVDFQFKVVVGTSSEGQRESLRTAETGQVLKRLDGARAFANGGLKARAPF